MSVCGIFDRNPTERNIVAFISGALSIPKKDVFIEQYNVVYEYPENGDRYVVKEVRFKDLSNDYKFRYVRREDGSYKLGRII